MCYCVECGEATNPISDDYGYEECSQPVIVSDCCGAECCKEFTHDGKPCYLIETWNDLYEGE